MYTVLLLGFSRLCHVGLQCVFGLYRVPLGMISDGSLHMLGPPSGTEETNILPTWYNQKTRQRAVLICGLRYWEVTASNTCALCSGKGLLFGVTALIYVLILYSSVIDELHIYDAHILVIGFLILYR